MLRKINEKHFSNVAPLAALSYGQIAYLPPVDTFSFPQYARRVACRYYTALRCYRCCCCCRAAVFAPCCCGCSDALRSVIAALFGRGDGDGDREVGGRSGGEGGGGGRLKRPTGGVYISLYS